jgi:hypothetical protein
MTASKEIDRTAAAAAGQQQTDRLLTTCEYRQLFCQDVAEYFEPTLQASRMQASNKTAILTE